MTGDLDDLGLDYVDLILLHGPSNLQNAKGACGRLSCQRDLGQWKAYEKLYKAGKAKAIGVSNYCISCLECLLGNPEVKVVPAGRFHFVFWRGKQIAADNLLTTLPLLCEVNQFELHVGMGADPEGLVSYNVKHGIVVQAYSPLGNGALISDPVLASIGAKVFPPSSRISFRTCGVAIIVELYKDKQKSFKEIYTFNGLFSQINRGRPRAPPYPIR